MYKRQEKRVLIENQIANFEMQRGNTVYIETYCMEFEAFQTQLEKKKELDKQKNTGLGA